MSLSVMSKAPLLANYLKEQIREIIRLKSLRDERVDFQQIILIHDAISCVACYFRCNDLDSASLAILRRIKNRCCPLDNRAEIRNLANSIIASVRLSEVYLGLGRLSKPHQVLVDRLKRAVLEPPKEVPGLEIIDEQLQRLDRLCRALALGIQNYKLPTEKIYSP